MPIDMSEFVKNLEKNRSEMPAKAPEAPAPEAPKIDKKEVAQQIGVKPKELDDKTLKGVQSGLRGAQVATAQGADPTKMAPQQLKALDPVKPAEEGEKSEAQVSKENKVMMALAAALPSLIGYAFGGARAGAAGGEIGAKTVLAMDAEQKDEAKIKREEKKEASKLAAAKAEKDVEHGFKREELDLKKAEMGQKDRLAQLDARLKGTEKGRDRAMELRKERMNNPLTKATQEVSTAYTKMQKAVEAPSAAGDMSLIFGYMKMLDPGSTVREGEQAMAEQARGVPDSVLAQYNRALKGERLTETQRADFLAQAENLRLAQLEKQEAFDAGFRQLAQKYDVPEDEVLLGFGQGTTKDTEDQRKQQVRDAAGKVILDDQGKPASVEYLKQLKEKRAGAGKRT